MININVLLEIDTTSLDAAIEKVRLLKAELAGIDKRYNTGNPIGSDMASQMKDKSDYSSVRNQ